jgi:hypothetical protein
MVDGKEHFLVLQRGADEFERAVLAQLGDVPLEVLELEPMASGERSLRLSTRVTWEEFASYAPAVVGLLGGRIVDRADSAPERTWSAIIDGQRFWISFDDFALGVSLDPQDHAAGELIPSIREKLLQRRGG